MLLHGGEVPPLIVAAWEEQIKNNMYKISGISNKENCTTDHLPRTKKQRLQTGLQLLPMQMIDERLEAGHRLRAQGTREQHFLSLRFVEWG